MAGRELNISETMRRPSLLHGAFIKRACATCSVPMPVAE